MLMAMALAIRSISDTVRHHDLMIVGKDHAILQGSHLQFLTIHLHVHSIKFNNADN